MANNKRLSEVVATATSILLSIPSMKKGINGFTLPYKTKLRKFLF